MKLSALISSTVIQEKKEGESLKRFFLPVTYNHNTGDVQCWFFLLAPFVLIFQIVKNALWSIWRDLIDFLGCLKIWNK